MIMTSVFDDGKLSKQYLIGHIIKSSKLRNSVDDKDYNYVLISKRFQKFRSWAFECTALESEVFLCVKCCESR
jgi:hypothetical protein